MSQTISGTQQLTHQLDILEGTVRELRELLQPQGVARPAGEVTEHPHIEQQANVLSGEPVIKGTRTPVRAIVEHWKFGDPPDEIARKLPHLRLAQIFDALSYYDDHRDEIERYIVLNRLPVEDESAG
jgi:uncharacterized protein (DUF433 family)